MAGRTKKAGDRRSGRDARRRVALVSGGNRGIGYAICRALARKGCAVVLGAAQRRRRPRCRSGASGRGPYRRIPPARRGARCKRAGYGRIVNLSSGLGQLRDMGTGTPAYRVSKTALNALTRMLAAELKDTGVLVNSMCPGWVRTRMGGRKAERTPEQAADTAVWLAMLPPSGPSGGFFRDRKRLPW